MRRAFIWINDCFCFFYFEVYNIYLSPNDGGGGGGGGGGGDFRSLISLLWEFSSM